MPETVTEWIEETMEYIDRMEMEEDEAEARQPSNLRTLTLKSSLTVHEGLERLAERVGVSKSFIAQQLLEAAVKQAVETLQEKQYFNARIQSEGVLVS